MTSDNSDHQLQSRKVVDGSLLNSIGIVETDLSTDLWLVEKKTTKLAILSFKNLATGKSEVKIYDWDANTLTAVTIGFDLNHETVVSDAAGDYFLILNQKPGAYKISVYS